ncbi:hypothetical protein [Ruminococcus flavefaciens]|uniref:Uncharacterized protein n=1 Tax=Ruminococcus flavefaciens 007c TaxID=1341157 RepID=W7V2L0_RUMFL|nr:hypothetical protein [Ruminococcus flavefaciens]EWM55067.1 hypothetical protein RF007C_05185 [Ruminococcus flavefaciens 007c]
MQERIAHILLISENQAYAVNGNVDMDICYKDFPNIIKGKGLNGFSKTEPTPTLAPDVQESNVTVTVQIGKGSYKGTLKKL